MGVNDKGVAIGNEAVFTKAERGEVALIGMDYVRLALERANNAKEAIDVISQLLEQYGQGGQCGYGIDLFYDNSFLIADPRNGYILETSGNKWVVRPFYKNEAISNELIIRTDHTMRGGVDEGYDFAGELSDAVLSRTTGARHRRKTMLQSLASPSTVFGMMKTLRFHHLESDNRKQRKNNICMHPEDSNFITSGSLVAVLRENTCCTLWITGSSLPCYSMFKPVFLGVADMPSIFSEATKTNAYWTEREILNRHLAKTNLESYFLQRDALEQEWLKIETELLTTNASADVLSEFTMVTIKQEKELALKFNINLYEECF